MTSIAGPTSTSNQERKNLPLHLVIEAMIGFEDGPGTETSSDKPGKGIEGLVRVSVPSLPRCHLRQRQMFVQGGIPSKHSAHVTCYDYVILRPRSQRTRKDDEQGKGKGNFCAEPDNFLTNVVRSLASEETSNR